MDDNSLIGRIKELTDGALPMHMPGHKRNTRAFPWLRELGGELDITEIAGADDLHAPSGVLSRTLERAARLYGAKRAFLSVNGGTGAVLAAFYACVGRGGSVLIGRGCHRSATGAAELLGARADYLPQPSDPETGLLGGVLPEELEKALSKRNYDAVFLTSPTYEGVTTDIREAARIVHSNGGILIVDESHGAHFALSSAFPESAGRAGADVVICGLHKTLPVLTQTALLTVHTDRPDLTGIARAMSLFVSSSPSYILMAAADKFFLAAEDMGEDLFRPLLAGLDAFYRETADTKRLKVLGDSLTAGGVNFKRDASKIYIDCSSCSLNGYGVSELLRDKFGIEAEYASPCGVLLLASAGDDALSLARLANAVKEADRGLSAGRRRVLALPDPAEIFSLPQGAPEVWEEISAAVEKICAESVYLYPPGVPVLVRGERVTERAADYLSDAAKAGAFLVSDSGAIRENRIAVAAAGDALAR